MLPSTSILLARFLELLGARAHLAPYQVVERCLPFALRHPLRTVVLRNARLAAAGVIRGGDGDRRYQPLGIEVLDALEAAFDLLRSHGRAFVRYGEPDPFDQYSHGGGPDAVIGLPRLVRRSGALAFVHHLF